MIKMNKIVIFVIFAIVFGVSQAVYAQSGNLDMELEVSDEEKIILFSGFAIAVLGVFLFLARDIILRKKTSYPEK